MGDKDKDRRLDMNEISELFPELGIRLACQEDQWEMKCLLNEVDADASGDFSFGEFAVLVQRLRDRLAAAARRRQRVIASKLGLHEDQVFELCRVFFRLDTGGRGVLAPDQLRRALETLRCPLRQDELLGAVARIDTDSTGQLNFDGFLKLFATANCTEMNDPSTEL